MKLPCGSRKEDFAIRRGIGLLFEKKKVKLDFDEGNTLKK